MPTECSAEPFDVGVVEGRAVEAAFDAGLVTSDAGAPLLGATDRAIDLVDRFADCLRDRRRPGLIEPTVAALVRQRVFGTALGYEDLDDHDEVRHDPVMAVVAGKLEARRADCAPVAGTTHQCDVSSSSPEQSTNPPVAVVAMLESQALNGVAQPGLLLAGCRSPPMPIIAGSADTGELAHGARFRSRLATGTPVIVWMTS